MRPFFQRFRTLQWQLTLSYTWVTTAVLVAVFLILLIVIASTIDLFTPNIVSAFQPVLRPVAPQISEFLGQDPPDLDGLRAWLDNSQQGSEFFWESDNGSKVSFTSVVFTAVTDQSGNLLALEPKGDLSQPMTSLLFAEALPAYEQALLGKTDPEQVTAIDSITNDIFVSVPVFDADQTQLGAFVLVMDLPRNGSQFLTVNTVFSTLPLLLIVFLLAGLVGTIFGFIASRGFSRRLHHLADMAESWSQGDFAAHIQDNASDEIGQLARRLNQMAEQLQNMVQTRGELATLEERNRLARDLHDSVKQQVFATTMQLGAARALLDSNPQQAAQHLAEAETLAKQSQQELTGLIEELRPAALADRGLAAALRALVAAWSRRTGIVGTVQVQGERPLSLPVEQALYRVAQEALTNVERHSQASRVAVQLAWQDETVTLTVQDDGQGFDAASPSAGLGLTSMQERLAAVNGRFHITSTLTQGTIVTASVKGEK